MMELNYNLGHTAATILDVDTKPTTPFQAACSAHEADVKRVEDCE